MLYQTTDADQPEKEETQKSQQEQQATEGEKNVFTFL